MRLSTRTAWDLAPSPFATALARARANGAIANDLTITNPTQAGFVHEPAVYRALGNPAAAVYDAEAFGLARARLAVADHYRRRSVFVDPSQVWLCASTSEAYATLFALLCDPGESVLVPSPGYPLLDHIAAIAGVHVAPYPLVYDGRWRIDAAGLHAALESAGRVRVIVAVAPGNPCGNALDDAERALLSTCCQRHELTLVIDEVFADYPLDGPVSRTRPPSSVPTLLLSGLSKVGALPQLKLAWVVALGPTPQLRPLWTAAELAADALLSVNTPVQLALPSLLAAADAMQVELRARLRANLAILDHAIRGSVVSRHHAAGGWTGLLRLPQLGRLDDVGWALQILSEAGVATAPGFLFDLGAPPRLAVSLIVDPATFAAGLERLVEVVERRCAHP